MSYTPIGWENLPNTTTPINKTNLNKMDIQIKQNADDIEEINTTLFNLIYPIGSIYETSDADFDPNNSFGGTWIKIEGKFLLASSEDYTIGDTGGNATHTLTTAQMPAHNHDIGTYTWKVSTGYVTGNYYINTASDHQGNTNMRGEDKEASYTTNTGGGQAFSIMPPYEVINVWKRTS